MHPHISRNSFELHFSKIFGFSFKSVYPTIVNQITGKCICIYSYPPPSKTLTAPPPPPGSHHHPLGKAKLLIPLWAAFFNNQFRMGEGINYEWVGVLSFYGNRPITMSTAKVILLSIASTILWDSIVFSV